MLRVPICLISLCLLSLSLMPPAHAAGRPLFVPARRTTAIDGMDDGSGYFSWLSDHALLTCRSNSAGDRSLVRVDLADKSVSRLGGLTEAFRPLDSKPLADPHWLASPDGKWVLFYSASPADSGQDAASQSAPALVKIVAVSIEGRPQLTFTQEESDSVVAWLPDGRRWVELTSTEAIFHTVDDPALENDIPLSPGANSSVSGFTPTGSTLLCVTPEGHAILISPWQAQPDHVTLCDLDLTANPVTENVTSIPLPGLSQINAIAVSPDGRRIAWEWDVSGPQNDDRTWWKEHDPTVHYSSDPDNLIELWMSDIDGTNFHMIGRADTGSQTLLWSPDGKTLYFTFGNYFWGFPPK